MWMLDLRDERAEPWAETWRRIWGDQKIFSDPISGKISIFRVKISDDFFFSHRLGSSDFPFLFSHFPYVYYVKCCIWPFPHKKTTIFHSVHTFTHIRQHCFSKYWGGPMHGPSSPPQILGGPSLPVPPRSPPLPLKTTWGHWPDWS